MEAEWPSAPHPSSAGPHHQLGPTALDHFIHFPCLKVLDCTQQSWITRGIGYISTVLSAAKKKGDLGQAQASQAQNCQTKAFNKLLPRKSWGWHYKTKTHEDLIIVWGSLYFFSMFLYSGLSSSLGRELTCLGSDFQFLANDWVLKYIKEFYYSTLKITKFSNFENTTDHISDVLYMLVGSERRIFVLTPVMLSEEKHNW